MDIEDSPSDEALWFRQFQLIRKMRQEMTAPVDVIGCDRLADPTASKKVLFSAYIRQSLKNLQDLEVSNSGSFDALLPNKGSNYGSSHEKITRARLVS